MKNLKTVEFLSIAIGLPVIFYFVQATGLTHFYTQIAHDEYFDPNTMITWIKSLYLLFPIVPLLILLWAIAFGLMTKAKGYNNIIGFLVFFVTLITIVGAVVYFFLPDKLKSASP